MFKIYITFADNGGSHIEEHSEDTVVSALQRLTRGPAAMMGIIEEVRVVDRDDCTNFLARKQGRKMNVLFPRA
jgi:hypothetical protein